MGLINFVILAGMKIYFKMVPTIFIFWMPVIIFYTMVVSLTFSLLGAALNVYNWDVAQVSPVALNFLIYCSPVIYPLSLVHKKLIAGQAAGQWSESPYMLYTLNPLAGIIDSFQRALLKELLPYFYSLLPGFLLTVLILPFTCLFLNVLKIGLPR